MNNSDFNLNYQNKSIESKIVASLERISQAFRVLLWQESKEFALTPIQIQVLIFIFYHHNEKCKVSYLADEFNLTKATISETIKTLEQKELITKEFDTQDTRSFTIQLTKNGKKIVEQTSLFSKEIFNPIDKLHQDDKETLLFSLLNIIKHLNQVKVITIQRMCFTCVYYKRSANGQKHFCNLLNQNLQTTDLRIDCPDYVSL
ncbi:MAG: winged helix-turn-helix transcriptional regulator [Chitinophagaceae bacterium]|nr:winged helix-turn-helix transcriptional regulator [Chitinophagaceae bacterium]MCW5904791.1 winged helix-turn-helix transcriptional regulator [Chitinophagaceae bacterium]